MANFPPWADAEQGDMFCVSNKAGCKILLQLLCAGVLLGVSITFAAWVHRERRQKHHPFHGDRLF
eukprot:6343751-Amphidinium_carterae.1